MRKFGWRCGAALGLAVAGAGDASARPPPAPPTPVEGLTVMGSAPPQVVATYPAPSAEVAPGELVLKVVFDQPMTEAGWAYSQGAGGELPPCLAQPRLLADRKTFVLLCMLRPDTRYAVRLNGVVARGFLNAGDRSARAYEFQFAAGDGEPVRTLDAAMRAAGLKDDESPIMGRGPAVGAIESRPPAAAP
ncbi:MAG: hypothetical protein IIZ63_11535 [Caulobacteraceae bacterium]|nr:hypothetical protein [Caulobacteraceae bacterium]